MKSNSSDILPILFSPEPMPGTVNEYIFQRRLAYRDRLNLSGECFGQFCDKAMALFLFQANARLLVFADDRSFNSEARGNRGSQIFRIVRGFEPDDVSADFLTQVG